MLQKFNKNMRTLRKNKQEFYYVTYDAENQAYDCDKETTIG